MYMIVLYHCLLLGGVITKATQIGIGSINYDISWLLETFGIVTYIIIFNTTE